MHFSTDFKSLSIGNRVIDSEHQKLGSIVNDIGQLILVNHFSVLSEAVKTLTDSLRDYFAIEENIAQAVNFDFAQHRLAHQTLLNNFLHVTDKLISQNGKLTEIERKVCMDSLSGSLNYHIQRESKPLKIVLDTYLYEFDPDEIDGRE